MAQTASSIFNAVPPTTGPAYWAPLVTVAPTNESTVLPAGFVGLGYLGEDGITEKNGRDTTKIKAFGGDTVARVQTDHTLTYTLILIEALNGEVMKAVYGSTNVVLTAASASLGQRIAVKKNSLKLPHTSFVFDVLDDVKKLRLYIPDGQIISTGDVKLVHTNIVSYEIEIETYADSTGTKAYQWTNDGKTSP